MLPTECQRCASRDSKRPWGARTIAFGAETAGPSTAGPAPLPHAVAIKPPAGACESSRVWWQGRTRAGSAARAGLQNSPAGQPENGPQHRRPR